MAVQLSLPLEHVNHRERAHSSTVPIGKDPGPRHRWPLHRGSMRGLIVSGGRNEEALAKRCRLVQIDARPEPGRSRLGTDAQADWDQPRVWARFGHARLGQSLKSQSGRQDSNLRPSAPKARVWVIPKGWAWRGFSPKKALWHCVLGCRWLALSATACQPVGRNLSPDLSHAPPE